MNPPGELIDDLRLLEPPEPFRLNPWMVATVLALLVFILCLGFYVTPAILGGGRVPMISNLLDTLINQIPRWEQASAISTILLIVALVIFAGYRRLDRKAST